METVLWAFRWVAVVKGKSSIVESIRPFSRSGCAQRLFFAFFVRLSALFRYFVNGVQDNFEEDAGSAEQAWMSLIEGPKCVQLTWEKWPNNEDTIRLCRNDSRHSLKSSLCHTHLKEKSASRSEIIIVLGSIHYRKGCFLLLLFSNSFTCHSSVIKKFTIQLTVFLTIIVSNDLSNLLCFVVAPLLTPPFKIRYWVYWCSRLKLSVQTLLIL